jgi:ADP-ribose pyrophosphatase YjhB (NUDIX family)
MTTASDTSAEIPCAAGILFDGARRLLLIRRGTPPAQGSWSLPGGRCLPDEPTAAACVREVAEETGLTVRVVALAGSVLRDAPGGGTYRIDDYLCEATGGVLAAGDDAADARWVTRAELEELHLAPLLREALTEWGQLPD